VPDERLPVARTALGCLAALAAIIGLMLLVRPAIFSLAPPRDDSSVVVASVLEASQGPLQREVVLATSHGLTGERPAGSGRVQLAVVVAPTAAAGYTVVGAASPIEAECPVELADGRLIDCGGQHWTLNGEPLDGTHPPLQRFAVTVRDGAVIADLSRPLAP
jgi:hypothetical protein